MIAATINGLGLETRPNEVLNCSETGLDGHEVTKEQVIVVGKQHRYKEQVLSDVCHVKWLYLVVERNHGICLRLYGHWLV